MSIEKRTCLGCRALTTSRRNPCLLKHRVKSVYRYPGSKPIPMPVNKHCPKPRTYKELSSILGYQVESSSIHSKGRI